MSKIPPDQFRYPATPYSNFNRNPWHLFPVIMMCLLCSAAFVSSTQAARRGHARPPSKFDCGTNIRDIQDCPDVGCGGSYDPQLNARKNLRSDSHFVRKMTFAQMQNLPNPTGFTSQNTNRDELRRLGEGRKIRIVAWALVARKGSPESCNCGLTAPKDTDNHIVLVDASLRSPTVENNEPSSETAEFTPRVRLSHPNFTRQVLQPLIDHNRGRLLVRVTGLLMFDSEHFLRRHLKRHNNWEIHPVLKMEYCGNGATCSDNEDTGWVDLDRIKMVKTTTTGASRPKTQRR
jgi:hypothetical protein